MFIALQFKFLYVIILDITLSIGYSKQRLALMTDLDKGEINPELAENVRLISMENSATLNEILDAYHQVKTNETIGISLMNIFSYHVLQEIALVQGRDVRLFSREAIQESPNEDLHFHNIKTHDNNETTILHTLSGRELKIAVIAYPSCTSFEVYKLKKYLKEFHPRFHCSVVSDSNQYSSNIHLLLSTIEYPWKLTHMVFLIPLQLLYLALQKMTRDPFYGITILTYGMDSAACDEINHKFPQLDIYNVIVNSTTVMEVERFWTTQETKQLEPKIEINELKYTKSQNITKSPVDNIKTMKIRAATVADPPYVTAVNGEMTPDGQCLRGINCRDLSTQQVLCCSGIAIEIFEKVVADLHLSYDMHLVEDGKFGSITPNGTWNGMVNEVYSNKADIGVHCLFDNEIRQQVVDYTHRILPNLYSKLIVTRTPAKEYIVVNFAFLRAMEQDLIIYVPLITSLVVVIVFALENAGYLLKYNVGYHAGESFSYINAILYQRDLGAVNPHRWPARFLSLVFAFAMTVLISAYTAQLTASNIDVQTTSTFKGLRDKQFRDKSFRVGVIDSSQSSLVFERLVAEGAIVQKPFMYVKNEEEGVERVHNKTLDAFVGNSAGLTQQIIKAKEYCWDLEAHYENRYIDEFHFIVQKGSPLQAILSESIFRLTENGELKYIMKKWNDTRTCRDYGHQFTRFPWEYFGGLVVLISGTTVLSGLILLVEKLVERIRTGRKTYVFSDPPEGN